MEKNPQYLQKAIQDLPTFLAPKENWDLIAAQIDTDIEYQKANLDQAIVQLSDTSMTNAAKHWQDVEADLNSSRMEYQKANLDQAIIQLQTIKAPDDQWEKTINKLDESNTIEYNKQALDQAILHLPTIENHLDQQWDFIADQLEEARITNDSVPLQQAVGGLPTLTAPDAIWDNIEVNLDPVAPAKVVSMNRRSSRPYWLSIAASLLLIVGLAWLLSINPSGDMASNNATVTIAFSEEETMDDPSMQNFDMTHEYENWEQAQAFITAYCSSLPPECANPEFSALQSQLHDIETRCTSLKNKLNETSEDIDMYSYLIRLEKQRNELTKTLIQMIVT